MPDPSTKEMLKLLINHPILIKYYIKALIKSHLKILKYTTNYITLRNKLLTELIEVWGIKATNDHLILNYKGHTLKFYHGGDIVGATGRLIENFILEEYKPLNVSNKIVIDVGSYICDSPIYFALNNAKIVYAFEPYPIHYNLCTKNIQINNMKSKIIAFNYAIWKEKGTIKINPNTLNPYAEVRPVEDGIDVKTVTIEDIVKEFLRNDEEAVLKMDCEGCEKYIVLFPNALSRFKEVLIEFDYGYADIRNALKNAGFSKVKVYNVHEAPGKRYTGFIYARK